MSHYDAQREADEKQKCCYEYGVEYETNGQYPSIDDDVIVEQYSTADNKWHKGPAGLWHWPARTITKFRIVDERYKPKSLQNAQESLKPQNPYQRTIIGLDGSKCAVDVYRVLEAFEVDSHAIAHAIKKLLAPGKRHAKTRKQDLKEAIASIEAELLLMSQR